MVLSVVEDPIAGFLYALRSPISKKKYPQRLRVFLRFLGFNGVFKDDALEFLKKAREDPERDIAQMTFQLDIQVI
jgi:hypothetical protein